MERKTVMIMIIGVLLILGDVSKNQVNAMTCQEALAALSPCLSFLIGMEQTPSGACCFGVETVEEKANTTQIRRDLCSCFKQAASSFGVNIDKAKQLPGLCDVQVPVPIDPNIDCNTIPAA